MIFGLVLLVTGGLMVVLGKSGLGSLPGDIALRRGHFSLYIPLGTSIVVSLVLTVLLSAILRR